MTQTTSDIDLNKTLQLFWKIENVPQISQQTEDFYKAITTRADRYTVRIPFAQKPAIDDFYNGALKRLLAMEKKFKSNSGLKLAYSEFMSEYINLGHMEKVAPEQIFLSSKSVYYLPHHAVLKESSLTTKLRMGFDGSAKSSNGKSLNDNLLKG
ncbi:uncharacterized protein LOC135961253 [Calliphora vicina]|uniref:uncharacterized protein LOC135961253 n=1 Tax=Calliphora vicina TaxID=7373 RepID=UPI00325A514B